MQDTHRGEVESLCQPFDHQELKPVALHRSTARTPNVSAYTGRTAVHIEERALVIADGTNEARFIWIQEFIRCNTGIPWQQPFAEFVQALDDSPFEPTGGVVDVTRVLRHIGILFGPLRICPGQWVKVPPAEAGGSEIPSQWLLRYWSGNGQATLVYASVCWLGTWLFHGGSARTPGSIMPLFTPKTFRHKKGRSRAA